VLLGSVIVVMLIVSANVANLLLSRALDRQKEVAVRAALGASRGRLLRQLLIESLTLAGIGGAAGLATAAVAIRVLQSSLPPNVLPIPEIGMDPTVVIFAVGLTLLTGVIFGVAPGWQAARTDVNSTLKATSRSASGGVRPFLRKGLACAELALATVLLVGAALLSRSLLELQRVPLGFDPDGVMSFQISLPPTKYNMAKRVAFYQTLAKTLRSVPGVRDAGISSGIPFGVGNYTQSPFVAPGSPTLANGASVPINWRVASPGFFKTLRIPLLRGRDFSESDTATAPPVMIVSAATARTMWGDADPIGRTVRRVADAVLLERRPHVVVDGHRLSIRG
jgi:putative ABC transport system permease protein